MSINFGPFLADVIYFQEFLPARRYASAGLCESNVSVRPSVQLSSAFHRCIDFVDIARRSSARGLQLQYTERKWRWHAFASRVCHTPVLCQNEESSRHVFFTIW